MNFSKLNRKQLVSIVKSNNKIIGQCNKQNLELLRASYLLNDRKSKYVEETVTIGRGNNKTTELRGYVRYWERFTDSSTGEVYKIERNKHVKTNGNWI